MKSIKSQVWMFPSDSTCQMPTKGPTTRDSNAGKEGRNRNEKRREEKKRKAKKGKLFDICYDAMTRTTYD
ncbi:hypothetical protein BOTNAR_0416g00020 [Botryotinia narcissicola]|uniref:Uncharacterized protein n=1 Tax=Botryotinia narcissicola TaxID=278944 RepID=A0A4Z1HYE0_9HELO|nr:hypothetical protein BOTNAR_0416g00020 [Botryotinia narcissicola]